jgi:uracil-DNA glycosylase family 4
MKQMDLVKSNKLKNFRETYFLQAKKHPLFENIKKTNGHIVFGKGSDNPRVVFVGEAPGQLENKVGKPFVGRSGKLLDEWISTLKLSEKDYSVINVVPIIPLNKEGIRKPTDKEIEYFLPLTKKYLEILNPELIVLLGRSSASIFSKNLKLGEVRTWENSKLFFIYHPSYYIRRGKRGFENTLLELKKFLDNNLKK